MKAILQARMSASCPCAECARKFGGPGSGRHPGVLQQVTQGVAQVNRVARTAKAIAKGRLGQRLWNRAVSKAGWGLLRGLYK